MGGGLAPTAPPQLIWRNAILRTKSAVFLRFPQIFVLVAWWALKVLIRRWRALPAHPVKWNSYQMWRSR